MDKSKVVTVKDFLKTKLGEKHDSVESIKKRKVKEKVKEEAKEEVKKSVQK